MVEGRHNVLVFLGNKVVFLLSHFFLLTLND